MGKGFCARISPNFATALTLIVAAIPAAAADVSAWDNDTRSSIRLIGANAVHDAGVPVLRAGVELKLQAGWKTYWRYPGDAGVPPVFDFSRSENVKSATVRWPAPERFADGGGYSIGYKGSVIFPLRIVPQDAAKPVRLRLNLDYAVCETLCIPAKGKAELLLAHEAGSQQAALRAAEARVPKLRQVGDGASFSISKVWRDSTSGKPQVFVEVASPVGIDVDLFAEGPSADWALPLPATVKGPALGARRFVFELDGLPPGATANGVTLKLTATAGQDAIEAVFRLD